MSGYNKQNISQRKAVLKNGPKQDLNNNDKAGLIASQTEQLKKIIERLEIAERIGDQKAIERLTGMKNDVEAFIERYSR